MSRSLSVSIILLFPVSCASPSPPHCCLLFTQSVGLAGSLVCLLSAQNKIAPTEPAAITTSHHQHVDHLPSLRLNSLGVAGHSPLVYLAGIKTVNLRARTESLRGSCWQHPRDQGRGWNDKVPGKITLRSWHDCFLLDQ